VIFGDDAAQPRLKWAFDTCKNGAWGDEPDGETDAVCIRAADFNADLGVLLDSERTLRAIDDATYRKVGLRAGDLVVEKSGGGEKQLVGRSVIYRGTERAVCSNFLARCRPSDLVTSEYLNYLMLGIYKARGTYPHIKQTTGIQNLDMASFLNTRVSLPPLETQKRIAALLDVKTAQIDALIARKQALLARLAEKRQATITQAVTKGLNPAAALKESGIEWLGQIPAHWDLVALGYRYEVQLGRMLNAERADGENLKPYLRVYDVQWGAINVGDLPMMDFPPEAQRRYRLLPGDLMVNEGGSYVGRSAIWQGELEECYYQKALHRLRPHNPQDDTSEFLLLIMEMATTRNVFVAGGNQTTIDHLTAEQLRRYRFAFPPFSEQIDIVANCSQRLTQISSIADAVSISLAHLAEYRAALITSAVTGQIAVLQ
jgi:type I restriction enzyme S subunit